MKFWKRCAVTTIAALCALVLWAPTAAADSAPDVIELRVEAVGVADMLWSVNHPAVFAGLALPAGVGLGIHVSPHLGVGLRFAGAFFGFKTGAQLEWSPGGWLNDGIVTWSGLSYRMSEVNCGSEKQCPAPQNGPTGTGGDLEIGVGYRWEFNNDDSSLLVGLAAEGGYLRATVATPPNTSTASPRYSGWYAGIAGPRVMFGF